MRKSKLYLAYFIVLLLFTISVEAQTAAFTYQGKLTDAAVTATGDYDMQFRLFDAGGTQVGATITYTGVFVSNGIFTVQLNQSEEYGAAAFTGADRFLEVSVRRPADPGYTPLSPRTRITSTPFAIRAAKATAADSAASLSPACVLCITDAQIGAVDGSKVTGTVANAALPAGNITGVLGATQGGTGIGPNFPPDNTYLRSNGTGWSFSGIPASDIPTGSANYIQSNPATQQSGGNFNIGGNGIVGGSLGIGTSTPVNRLHLHGNSPNFALTLTNTANQVNRRGYRLSFDNDRFTFQKADDAGNFEANHVAIDPATGNVGIGTINPIEKLDVNGNIKFSGTLAGNGSGLINVPGTMRWQSITGNIQQAQSNNGYLATDAGLVTITLPANPAVGDIVRVSGVGAGGWKIAENAGQVVLGANLDLLSLYWTPRESNRFWNSIASSADGSNLAATVQGGQIYTSTDSGVTWIPRETARQWWSIASSADGNKLVAVVGGPAVGQIYTSTDSGVSWIPREAARNWRSVASSADGSKLVAVVAAPGGGQIYTSTDSGATWTPRDANRFWFSVASSADGVRLVAVVNGGQIYTSTDSGVNWTAREGNRPWNAVASSADGNKLVAVVGEGDGFIYTSTDSGITWTARENMRGWWSVASSADGTKLIAPVIGGQIYTSTDSGANWKPREGSRNWYAVASSADGTKLAGVVSAGRIYTSTSNTTIGISGYLIGNQFNAVELQYIGNGQFIPISHEGAIAGF